jgi:predicted nucleic acid-binding protein
VDLSTEVLRWVVRPGHAAVTSTVTIAEVLVKAYERLDEEEADRLYGLLTTHPNLEWFAPDLEIGTWAARFRADYRLKTPDALQAATAFLSGATAFITNDATFERVQQFETLMLDRLL